MTIAELIAHLQTLPQDLLVVAYDACECSSLVGLEDIHVGSVRYWNGADNQWVTSTVVEIMP